MLKESFSSLVDAVKYSVLRVSITFKKIELIVIFFLG